MDIIYRMDKTLLSVTRILTVLLISFSLISTNVNGQDNAEEKQVDYDYNQELPSLSLYGEHNLYWQTGNPSFSGGVRFDINTEVIGFYYKIGAGTTPEGKACLHVPGGLHAAIVVATYLNLGYYSNNYSAIPIILCALIPEGVTVKIWKRENYNLKIYASPWSADIGLSEKSNRITGELGFQGSMFNRKKLNVSCYAGTKFIYKHFQPAFTVGATLGILID